MPSETPTLPVPAPARTALAPRYWGAHLLVLLALAACILLGRWQLGVWHEHRTDQAGAITHESPVPLDGVLGPDAAFPSSGVGRPVVVEGRWDAGHTTYVSGRVLDGRTGFWVVTPVITSSGSGVPVVRGWTPATNAAPPAPHGSANLVGLLQPSDDTGAPDPDPRDDVIPEMSVTDLLPRAPYDLYSGYVVATSRAVPSGGAISSGMNGLDALGVEHLPGADASTALRNLLYAFQWWVFGAFGVFMWWRWLQEDVLGRRASPRPR